MAEQRGYYRGLEDQELVAHLASGDPQQVEPAARVLFERHFERLIERLGYSFGDLGSADVEEIAADALTRLFRKPNRFNPAMASLRTYLAVIARNLAIDRVRRQSRVTLIPLSRVSAAKRTEIDVGHRPNVVLPRDAVTQAIAGLPSAEREATELQWKGLKIAEIAAELDCTRGAVRTRLSRAKARLRKGLGLVQEAEHL